MKTIACLHDGSCGTQAFPSYLENLTKITIIITMAARASSTNFEEIVSNETTINKCKFYPCDVSEVLGFPWMVAASSISF